MNLRCIARRLAAWLAALTLSSAAFALAPYDSTGATIELVPVAGGAAVATTHVTFPPDAATVNLAIPLSVIAAMAPGTSVSFFARVTSDALTAGSTCTANALSRQITFTKAGSVTAASVPTLGTLGLLLLAGLMGVAAYRNRRVRGALNVLLPVIAIAALSLGSAPSLNAQATDPNTTYAGSVNDAIQSVRAVVDAAGNVGVAGTRANNCEGLPSGPPLADVGPILDFCGNPISFNLNALGGLPSGSAVVAVTGFPLVDDIGVPTNLVCNASGACTGVYDVGVSGTAIGFRKTFPVTVKVSVPGFTRTLNRPANIIIENEC